MIKALLSTLLICSHSYAWTNIALSSRSTSTSTSTSSLITAEFIDSASESESNTKSTRRDFLVSALATATTIVLSTNNQPSFADEEDLIDVYFGCGCFWHVQQ